MIHYNTIDSTHLEAKRLIDSGVIVGNEIITADEMTEGITTKKDIKWYSPVGNLYLTIVLAKTNTNAQHVLLCTSLAVIGYLKRFNLDAKIKWPNDVLIKGVDGIYRKTAGVIAEGYKGFIIIGIGLNIAKSPQKTNNFPATDILKEFGSLDDININDARDKIVKGFYEYLEVLITYGFQNIKQQWKKYAFGIGGTVSFVGMEEKMLFVDITDEGLMLCKKQNGCTVVISADEITSLVRT